jgi:membrane protease YdiL (CAAX protease family)
MSPAFAAYVAPARARAELWRTALGFGLIVAVYFATLSAVGAAIWGLGRLGLLAEGGPGRVALGSDPAAMLLLLYSFLGGWLAVWLVVRRLHRRGLASVIGPPRRVLADFLLGVAALVGIGGGLGLLALPWLPPLQPATPPGLWLALLPLALPAVLVQTGAEELVFRGYLQQQLAARFAAPAVWRLGPSLLFGLAHAAPGEPAAVAWLVVGATALFGLIAADLTARSGSLGLAWGLHFANNLLALLVVAAMAGLDGLALLRLPEASAELLVALVLFDMALLVAVWATCRLVLSRR